MNQWGTTIVCFPLPNIPKITKIEIGDNEEEEVSAFLGFFMKIKVVVFDKFCGVLNFFLKDNDVDILKHKGSNRGGKKDKELKHYLKLS